MTSFKDINFHPSDRELRIFSLLWLAGFGLFGLLLAWRGGALGSGVPLAWQAPWRAPLALWGVSLVGSLLGLAAPAAMRPIYVAWMVAAFPIGWVVSLVLLTLIFFVVFTPVAIVFRLAGRDPLRRRFDRAAPSYWVPRQRQPDVPQYFKQF